MSATGDKKRANLVAKVIFMRPELGGRKNPVISGYRGQFFYDETDCDAVHVFETKGEVPFGVAILDHVFLTNPIHVKRVSVGMPILIREGINTVAYGQIISINSHPELRSDVPLRRRSDLPSAPPPETEPQPDTTLGEGSESSVTSVDAYWLRWHEEKESE